MAGTDRLSVDLDGLEDFARNLDSIRNRLNATGRTLNRYEGDMGSERVQTALDSFESNWSDGREKIDKSCKALSKMADQAVKSLREADSDLATKLEKSKQKADGQTSESQKAGGHERS